VQLPVEGSPIAPLAARTEERTRQGSSHLLHQLGQASEHAYAGLVVAAAVLLWAVVGAFFGFPGWWQTVLYSVGASVTLVMLFAIQHTQSRRQTAIQRKLDELLRSHAAADNRFIGVEEPTGTELPSVAVSADRGGETAATR
jgi:low affinity Fe/Cu permease